MTRPSGRPSPTLFDRSTPKRKNIVKNATLLFEVTDPAQVGFPVRLYQHKNGEFSVLYGSELHDGLSYADAAREFGLCLFHALACIGRLDNSRT